MVNLIGTLPALGALLEPPERPRAPLREGARATGASSGTSRSSTRTRRPSSARSRSLAETASASASGARSLAPARVRMRLEVGVAPVTVGDVRVALGRRDVGVPEHLLHAAEVGAALEQVRRERMAQEVRMHAPRLEARPGRRAGAG